MNHERENQPEPRFRLEFESGVQYLCNRYNSEAFLHSEEPQGDHIYIKGETPEDSAFIFRRQIPNFNEIIEYMRNTGFSIVERQILDDNDRSFYHMYIEAESKLNPTREPENAPQEELDWISPRKEQIIKNAVGFLIYLAEHGKLD